MALREEGDGSVSNDYDEIPYEGIGDVHGYSRMQSDPPPNVSYFSYLSYLIVSNHSNHTGH